MPRDRRTLSQVDAAGLVRAKGGRMTLQRRLVLQALQRARHHATADDIARSVRAVEPRIDPSTVYRNLEALEAVGLATHTHIDGRVTRWHRADAHPHGHLVCTSCGREDEIALAALEPLRRRLRADLGFEADLAHSAIAGICRACARVSST